MEGVTSKSKHRYDDNIKTEHKDTKCEGLDSKSKRIRTGFCEGLSEIRYDPSDLF